MNILQELLVILSLQMNRNLMHAGWKLTGSQLEYMHAVFPNSRLTNWWPGYQRPVGQTELAGFAYWDMKGSVDIKITTKKPVKQVVIRPLSLGIITNGRSQ